MAAVIFIGAMTGDNNDPEGWASIIMALLVCSGAILFSLGLIAEYLGVALHVLVGKPLYLTVESPRPGTSIDRRSREHCSHHLLQPLSGIELLVESCPGSEVTPTQRNDTRS